MKSQEKPPATKKQIPLPLATAEIKWRSSWGEAWRTFEYRPRDLQSRSDTATFVKENNHDIETTFG
ncbi:MAG: hypothetical protein H7Y38_18155 [Armatimonadetes bacterium]|nr:hypothetical protein [Armatimonadota bacterium]